MRKANLIQTAIWDEPCFYALPPDAKLVYLLLLTQAKVTAVGALDIAPKRWADATGLSAARLSRALVELEDADFIWTDAAKEELVIRSWVKHNVEGSPKMQAAATAQFVMVTSRGLRHRLQTAYPSLLGAPEIPYPENLDTLSDTPSQKHDAVVGVEVQRGRGTKVLSTSVEDARARVWVAYQHHHPAAKLTAERRRLIDNRLSEGYTADQLIAAVDGNHRDAYCNGANPAGRHYHALDLILRNADKIEHYASVPVNGNHAPLKGAEASFALAHQLQQEGR